MSSDNKFAVLSLVFGLVALSIPLIGIIFSILAILFYFKQKKIVANGMATAGLVLGAISFIIWLIVIFFICLGVFLIKEGDLFNLAKYDSGIVTNNYGEVNETFAIGGFKAGETREVVIHQCNLQKENKTLYSAEFRMHILYEGKMYTYPYVGIWDKIGVGGRRNICRTSLEFINCWMSDESVDELKIKLYYNDSKKFKSDENFGRVISKIEFDILDPYNKDAFRESVCNVNATFV